MTARPTTLAGVLALAEYLPGAIRQVTFDEETEGERALRNIAAALRDLVPPAAPSGELVALVEQWRDLGRQMDARPDAPGAFERLSARHTALQFAVYRFPAASVADLAAKVPVFRDEMEDATDASPIEGAADTLAGSAWLGLFRDLERLSGPAAPPVRSETPDPILAAVAASHAAEAEMRAFQDEMPDVNPPEVLARESLLSDAQVDMRNAVWATVPTTRAGRRALVDYAAFQVRLHKNGEGYVTSPDELFEEILGAMGAAVDAEWPETTVPLHSADAHVFDLAARLWSARLTLQQADARLSAEEITEEEWKPFCEGLDDLMLRLAGAEATTWLGIACKCLVLGIHEAWGLGVNDAPAEDTLLQRIGRQFGAALEAGISADEPSLGTGGRP